MKSQGSELELLNINIASTLEIVIYFGTPGTESEDCRTPRDSVNLLGLACTKMSAGIDMPPNGACCPAKSQYNSTVLLPTRADFRQPAM
jgi:hypothetical protein